MRRLNWMLLGSTLSMLACGGSKTKTGDSDCAPDAGPCQPDNNATDGGPGWGIDDSLPDAGTLALEPAERSRLRAREDEICLLSKAGDVQCRSKDAQLTTVQKGPFVAFALGVEHGCGLSEAGAITCWGAGLTADGCSWSSFSNECGQALVPSGQYKAVAAGDKHTCALDMAGTAHCWGYEEDGRLAAPTGSGFTQLVGSGDAMCVVDGAVDGKGVIQCWGGASSPADPVTSLAQLSLSGGRACWVTKQGEVNCTWGVDDLETHSGYAQIVPYSSGVCALRKTGRVVCAGGGAVQRVSPDLGPFTEIAADDAFACGLRENDELVCWGPGWGEGSDTEVCSIGKLESAVASNDLSLSLSNRSELDGAYSFDIDHLGLLKLRTPEVPLADGETGQVSSAWLVVAPDESHPAKVMCVGADSGSTIRRHDDELLLDLKQMRNLSCPGTPVAGKIQLCGGFNCPDDFKGGTLDGKAVTDIETSYFGIGGAYQLSTDKLEIRAQLGGDDDSAPQPITWSLIFTRPDSAWGGKVFCAGSSSQRSSVGEWPDDYDLWELSDLSVLPDCTGGEGSFKGCAR